MDGCMVTENNSNCKEHLGNCGNSISILYFVLFMLVGMLSFLYIVTRVVVVVSRYFGFFLVIHPVVESHKTLPLRG